MVAGRWTEAVSETAATATHQHETRYPYGRVISAPFVRPGAVLAGAARPVVSTCLSGGHSALEQRQIHSDRPPGRLLEVPLLLWIARIRTIGCLQRLADGVREIRKTHNRIRGRTSPLAV